MKPRPKIYKQTPAIQEITKNLKPTTPPPNTKKKKEAFNIKEYIEKLKEKFKCKCTVNFD